MDVATTVLFYDADCGFCRWSVSKILAWDRGQRLHAVPLQAAEADEMLPGMTDEDRKTSWHLVTNGRVRSGGAAVAPLLRLLPGGAPLATLAGLAPSMTDTAYRWVADHRERLGLAIGERACAVDLETGDGGE